MQIAKPPSRSTELRQGTCSGGVWRHSNYCLAVQARREQEASVKGRKLFSQCWLKSGDIEKGEKDLLREVYCSRSLARQYILQYAALIYCNNCNMYVVHIAIYCNILIYRNILHIANILQYIVYCNNILYIATIYRILQQYIVYCRSEATQTVRDDYLWLRLKSEHENGWIWEIGNWSKSKKFYKKKKFFLLATNSREFHIAIYCSRSLARQYILQYSPQTPVYIAIFASGSNILQYCVYCNILPIYCSRNIRFPIPGSYPRKIWIHPVGWSI